MREAVLQRGVRADEAAPGSGLGLAIVRELAELYGGSIALGGVARRRPARHPPPARRGLAVNANLFSANRQLSLVNP